MRFVADRFVVHHDAACGFALDVATGELVWLIVEDAGDALEQRAWLVRCDELFRLRHPALAPLVDYGTIGSVERFEAWSATSRWRGSDDHAAAVVRAAGRFFTSIALCDGRNAASVVERSGAPVVVPSSYAGYATVVEAVALRAGDRSGISLIERSAIAALREMLVSASERRPRVACLWGGPRAGIRTAVRLLARDARVNGLIPIDVQLLHTYRALVHGRSLFAIERNADAARGLLVPTALDCARTHVHLFPAVTEISGVDSLALTPVPFDALVAAVRPSPRSEPEVRRLQRAAERSQGIPGRFVRLLWPDTLEYVARAPMQMSRVAERSACYTPDCSGGSAPPRIAATAGPDWAAAGELTMLGRRVDQATALLAAGRHAPGLRLLRQTVGALARRHAWASAARGALALSAELQTRGLAREALRVLEAARQHAGQGGDAEQLLEIAVRSAECRIDLARLDDAERVLAAAQVSARAAEDRERGSQIAIALARCLFWRPEYADAAAALVTCAAPDPSSPLAIRRLRLTASIAIAQGDSAAALAAVDEARAALGAPMDVRLLADIEHTAAFVKLNVGDLDGVARDAMACIAAARAAKRPVRALAARLLLAEAERRRGSAPPVALARLARLAAASPPIVKARWDLLQALVSGPDDRGAAGRLATATGLRALELFAPAPLRCARTSGKDRLFAETVEILQVCQTTDDEVNVLREVCARLRRQLHAAAVAFATARAGRCDAVVADGARLDLAAAVRAIELGVVVGPSQTEERIDAAAPIHYAGELLGAIAARWTVGTLHDRSNAGSILSMAAAASAPVLSAIIARRAQASQPATADLIGLTRPMADLRQSIALAAGAPFPVLVEGESGSGKELVARGIHRGSPRRDRPFCTLNCAALPDDLVESELFGHARGAFTGAASDRAGVFEEAHGGTLLLDEVGELSPRAQAKLLRVLQEGELRRIGENIARRIDVRVVAATNRDLRKEVAADRFRLDLLYRLDVIRIVVPPLRERREDLAILVEHFWTDATRRIASRATLAAATRAALASYDWPGNVRELQNVLAALAVRSPKRGVVPPSALPPHIGSVKRPEVWRLDAARRTFEAGFVRAALVRAGGHRSRAADELGVTRQGLTKLMARLGID